MPDDPRSVRSLKKLLRQGGKVEHQSQLAAELMGESSRAAAIIGATILHDALRVVFTFHFREEVTETERDMLMGPDRPLGSMSARIRIAYALNLIGPLARDHLETIREIRNAFAHGHMPLTFDTPEIAAVCRRLKYHERFPDLAYMTPIKRWDWPPKTPKEVFVANVAILDHKLFDVTLRAVALKYGTAAQIAANPAPDVP